MTTEPIAPATTADSPSPRWQRKAWKDMSARERVTGCGGAIALLFLCGLCAQAAGNDKGEAELANRAASVANATPTTKPKANPASARGTMTAGAIARATVLTKAQQTEDARPTSDVSADAEAEAAAVREYLAWTLKTINEIQPTMVEFGDQMKRMGSDTSLIFDDDWKLSVATSLAMFEATADAIDERDDVPVPALVVHGHMKDLAEQYHIIRRDTAAGLDALDADVLASASRAGAAIGTIVRAMTADALKLQARYGEPSSSTSKSSTVPTAQPPVRQPAAPPNPRPDLSPDEDRNCGDFKDNGEAQDWYDFWRSPDRPNPGDLDGDNDGEICEQGASGGVAPAQIQPLIPQVPPAPPAGPNCVGARTCATFGSHAEAQAYWEACGRPSQMDRDGDGVVCENL